MADALETGRVEEPRLVAPGRMKAFFSWITAGYRIGWDLGQGLVFFLPMGLLRPSYAKNNPPKGIFVPIGYLADYLISPLCGAFVGMICAFPGLLGGLFYKQEIKNQDYHYAMDIVKQYSATAVWGALVMSGLLTVSFIMGGASLPAISVPSLPLYLFSTPALSMPALVVNLIMPIMLAYSLMVGLSVGQSFLRVYHLSERFALYQAEKSKWPYTLRTTVDHYIKDPHLNKKIHTLLQLELEQMSAQHTVSFDQLRQTLERDPTATELAQTGVLNRYELMRKQRDFVIELSNCSNETKQAALLESRSRAAKQSLGVK